MNSRPVIGGVYWVKDRDLTLPPDNSRSFYPNRTVLVLSGPGSNGDPAWMFVLVAPISSETTRKTRYCVKLAQGEGNVSKKCWVRVPAVQPLLKSQLGDHLGVIPAHKLEETQARLFEYMGMADDEASDG